MLAFSKHCLQKLFVGLIALSAPAPLSTPANSSLAPLRSRPARSRVTPA